MAAVKGLVFFLPPVLLSETWCGGGGGRRARQAGEQLAV